MKFEEMERLFADDNYYYYYYKVTLWTAAPRLAVKNHYFKSKKLSTLTYNGLPGYLALTYVDISLTTPLPLLVNVVYE